MFKIGVVGAGHLGKVHLKILKNASFVNLIGFYDSDPLVRKNIKSELGIKSFETYQELIENSDIIDIVTPTLSHYTCAKEALKHDYLIEFSQEDLDQDDTYIIDGKPAKFKMLYLDNNKKYKTEEYLKKILYIYN